LEALPATRATVRTFEDLEAFQRAMSLVQPIHEVALALPGYEKFDLASQMRRASKSIPANIAEGYGKRRSIRSFKVYLENALGSTNEMIAHIQIARSLGYSSEEELVGLLQDYRVVGKMPTRLIEKWR
jgi:four helix bundle protein